ncbi:MAG: aminodeoxychorismate synthase component I [Gammaproteobacteria bacterium]|nr:aminodeoxychorismate synthase component I [Gammaproteobacteria bacterium]
MNVIRQLDIYPDLLGLHLARPQYYPFLLESVAHGTSHARYDILFACPGRTLALGGLDTLSGDGLSIRSTDFLDNLDAWWSAERVPAGDTPELPFSGGWFIYLGYELAGQVEPCLKLPANTSNLPVAFATRIPAAVIRDHVLKQAFLVAEADQAPLLEEMERDLKVLANAAFEEIPAVKASLEEDEPSRFLQGVRRIKDYIVEGDVFQVNLSRAYRGRLTEGCSHAQVYRSLRKHNPAPFAGLLTYGGSAVVSSSPERLVRVRGDVIETRPIAGTRPRGKGEEDRILSQTLLAHPKERAEHVMLIDLERNDLGRVCVPGSVRVDELMALESYAHVHHIVSNVRGAKRPDVTPGQVIRAVFPGGTITGCPKVRCMEIIAELERTARGPYTGAMGYLNRDGGMDLNILIRTLLMEGDRIELRVGAGIVADSVPEAELEETRAKAKGLLLALGGAL